MINIENEKDAEISKATKNSKLKKTKVDLEIDEESESEEVSDISFSISKPSDIDELCEKISNKSNDDLKFVYENTLKTAEDDLMKDIDAQLKNLAIKEPGFNKDIKIMSSNLYKSISQSLSGLKGQNQNNHNLDKTVKGLTNFGSTSEAFDDQTIRLKNDLSGEPVMIGPDLTEMTDLKFNQSKFTL